MAIRTVRELGDPILRKRSKEVTEITEKIEILVEDMIDTMYEYDGVGLAAQQVGVLRRIFDMDVGEGHIVMINPEILETSGEQTGDEGCLSVPQKAGLVTRPNYVKVKAYDLDMQPFVLEGEELFARCVCHEYDHLDGIIYVDKVEGELKTTMLEEGQE